MLFVAVHSLKPGPVRIRVTIRFSCGHNWPRLVSGPGRILGTAYLLHVNSAPRFL